MVNLIVGGKVIGQIQPWNLDGKALVFLHVCTNLHHPPRNPKPWVLGKLCEKGYPLGMLCDHAATAKLFLSDLLGVDYLEIKHDLPKNMGLNDQFNLALTYRKVPFLVTNGVLQGKIVEIDFLKNEGEWFTKYEIIEQKLEWPEEHSYATRAATRCVEERLATSWIIQDGKIVLEGEKISVRGVEVSEEASYLYITKFCDYQLAWAKKTVVPVYGFTPIRIFTQETLKRCEKIRKEEFKKQFNAEWVNLFPPDIDAVEVTNFEKNILSLDQPPPGYARPWVATDENGEFINAVLLRVKPQIRVPETLIPKVRGRRDRSINKMKKHHKLDQIEIIPV